MSTNNNDDESEEFGSGKREVTGYTDGLHSPWGLFGQIMNERGYTKKQLLWGDSWLNMMMENADAPRYIRGKRPAPVANSSEDIKRILENRK